MRIFKPYSNIKDFLYRFTILKIGKLHIRIHKIVSEDKTTFFHNHPFNYVSFILKGGYTETVLLDKKEKDIKHNLFSIIIRSKNVYHRIKKADKITITLFFAYGNYGWNAINTKDNDINEDGIFLRNVNGKELWSKRENHIWFIGHNDYLKAKDENRHSIHQV